MEQKKPAFALPRLISLGRTELTRRRMEKEGKVRISKDSSAILVKRGSSAVPVTKSISSSPSKVRHSTTPLRVQTLRSETPKPTFPSFSIQEITFLKVIGKGSTGQIMTAEVRGLQLAVKILSKKSVKMRKIAEAERIALNSLQHPLIVKYYGSVEDEGRVYLLLERLMRGDLFHVTKKRKLREKEIRFYTAEVLAVLRFMHSRRVVYRDLKPENVMLHEDGHIRLIDFGFAKLMEKERTYTSLGSPEYMAPELVLKQPHSFPVDIWSFGVLLYELYAQ